MAVSPEETQKFDNEPTGVISSISHHVMRPVRPLLPHLLPFAICLLCIPVLMMMSGIAGWLVWKGIPVGWKEDVYLQYGDSVNPYANVELPHILFDQPYDVSLHLVVPATESNFALGNFMTSLRLSNSYNETLIVARRPAVLVRSRPSYFKQLILSTPPTVKMQVPLLSNWIAGTADVKAYIELGRHDLWRSLGNGQSRELSVLQAILKGTVKPIGVQSLSSRYPRLITFLSSFIFFFFAIVVIGVMFCAMGMGGPASKSHRKPPFSDQSEDSDPEENEFVSRNEGYEDTKSKAWVSRKSSFDPNAELPGVRRRLIPEGVSSQDTFENIRHVKMEESTATH